ncbi:MULTISPECIES: hypothetical protein [Streptomyces]|uniref:hypothetical protein n=1 Tax=Streptomyces TaxID=1883 RepID=UPI0004CD277B|nr:MULTISPECIES: hypothetical protein [Streptomyces]KOT57070.1 hypothetical protein ADK43_21805 [Streptomyces rimosus subsp. rimosus]
MTDDSLRDRYARAMAEAAGSRAFHNQGSAWDHVRSAWYGNADAAMAIADDQTVEALRISDAATNVMLNDLRSENTKMRTALANAWTVTTQLTPNRYEPITNAVAHSTGWNDAMDVVQRALAVADAEQIPHRYLSTGCLHGEHGYCQSHTGLSGSKTPASCKFCKAPCQCLCHRAMGTEEKQ